MDRRLEKRNVRRRRFVGTSTTQASPMSAAVPLNLSALREGTSVAATDAAPEHGVAVSVVMPTLNEAAQIGQAVADLSWANEVIVVDGGSTDRTAAIAEAAGARVMVVCGETIAAQRNAGIEAARNRWILALDADERVTSQLRAEISPDRHGAKPDARRVSDEVPQPLPRPRAAPRTVGARLAHAALHQRAPLRVPPRPRAPRVDRRHRHAHGADRSPPVSRSHPSRRRRS